MNFWFTADTHFRHPNIIKYCNRPFKDSVEMNESMISNWNNVVKDGDIVYHLGDFGFVKSQFEFNLYFKRLKGLIILIKGNHDNSIWNYRHSFYSHSDSYREIEINNQKITLCHYAMKVWNKSHSGAWHLFGHSHGSLPDDPHSLSFDVGVDCHNYTPINFEQVKEIMNKKFWKPIDHHGERKDGGGIGATPKEYAKLERKRYYEQLKEEFET